MSTPRSSRIAGLDGLRAIAVVGVVLYHMFPNVVPGGFLGVCLFFSLTGYLLVYSTRRELRRGSFTVGSFYLKRLRRLYPLLIVTLFGVALLLIPIWDLLSKPSFSENLSVLLGYNNWWQIAQNSSYFTRVMNSSPLTHLWYMGLTIQYNLLWPLLLLFGLLLRKVLLSRHLGWITLALGFLSAIEMALLFSPDADPSRIYYGTDTRAFSLLFGMALALLPTREFAASLKRMKPAAVLGLFFGTLAAIAVFYLTVRGESAATYRGLMVLANLVFLLLMFLVVHWQSSLGQLLEAAPLRWLGSRSYSIYLVMYPCIYFFQQYFSNASQPAMQVLCLLVILMCGESLWRLDGLLRRLSGFYPAAGSESLRKKAETSRPVAWLLNVSLSLILCVSMAALSLGVSARQSAVFSATHNTDDLSLLEAELEANAAMLAEQSTEMLSTEDGTAATTDAATGGIHDPYPYDIPCDAQKPEGLIQQTVTMTAIGDSVMLGAADQMRERIPSIYVDAAQSRQVSQARDVASKLYQAGHLGKTVILHLGTNSMFREDTAQELLDYLGSDRYIYWMTCHAPSVAHISEANALIRELAEKNDNLTVLDWDSVASYHSDWFYSDGIHLDVEGRIGYTDFLADALDIPEASATGQNASEDSSRTTDSGDDSGTIEASTQEETPVTTPAGGGALSAPSPSQEDAKAADTEKTGISGNDEAAESATSDANAGTSSSPEDTAGNSESSNGTLNENDAEE